MPKFKNKDGSLSAYALACGYVESKRLFNATVTLFMEHSHYHVQVFDAGMNKRILWETFTQDELSKARKYFNNLIVWNERE
jgi:hypothetical protein